MADIPKPRQARPSGAQPVGVLAPYDIAQTADIGRGLQNLGGALLNIGEEIYQKEADREFTEFMLKQEEAYDGILKAAQQVEPDAVPGLYGGFLESAQKDIPKNNEARRRLQRWQAYKIPQWNRQIESVRDRRYDEKYDATIQMRIDKMMTDFDTANAEREIADINNQRQTHQNWTQEKADLESEKIRELWEYKAWLNRAQVEPEKVLSNVKVENGKYYLKGIDGLPDIDDTGKAQAIANNARGALAEIDAARRQRAAAFDDDVTSRMIAGQFFIDGTSIKELIANNPDLDGPQRRTLSNFYNARVGNAGKKYSDAEKFAAYVEIDREKDPEKKMQLLAKHAEAIGAEKAISIYKSMTDPDDIMNDPFYSRYDESIESMFEDDSGAIKREDMVEYAETKEALKDIAKEAGKDYAKAQKQIETLTEKPKEEKAKSIFSFIWGPVKRPPYPGTESLYGIKTAPKGLESVWDELNREERTTAINAIQRGVTAKEIIEILNGK